MSPANKRLWLGILWGCLLFVGAPIFVLAYVEDWDFWGFALSKLPIAWWAMWTFIMLYDVWIAARLWMTKEVENGEAQRRKTEISSD